MNEQDIRNDSQKYLEEMMRFYSMNKNASISNSEKTLSDKTSQTEPPDKQPPEPVNDDNESENSSGTVPENSSDKKINENTEKIAYDKPYEDDEEKEVSFESRFPVPVIPDFIKNSSGSSGLEADGPEPDEESDSYGFLKAEVRTGENSMPVPGAAITVSQKKDGAEKIIFTGSTGQSGESPKIKLPAPVNSKSGTPESFESYSLYTISVFAKDFYREISADVPVFAGVTSIQRFNLIPLPFNYDDKGQSIVNRNTEPEI